jgi:HK97 family phage major capsid protein
MDKKELMQELENLKAALQTAATAEAKAQIEAKMAELKSKLDEIETLKAQIVVLKDAADKNQEALDGLIAAKNAKAANPETKSFNILLAEGITENADKIKSIKKGQSVSFEMKAVADMTFGVNFATADNSVTTVRPGIIELPKRKLHIRQLLNGGAMGTSNFAYVKEVAGEEAPETVLEGGAKNQFHLSLQEVESPSQYVAGYIRISRKMLDDVQGMTTFLQSRLLELLLRTEDTQIISGDGTSPNLSGITDSGNFTAASTSETAEAMMLIDAISQLEGYDREANGILLNPTDYWNLAKLTNLNQSSAVVTSENGVLRIGGVPVFRSTAVTADKYIVGDWVMGANLLTREAPRVEFFYEDGTNVTTNKVTVRVEERVALPIYGSNYFIYGDFGNVS